MPNARLHQPRETWFLARILLVATAIVAVVGDAWAGEVVQEEAVASPPHIDSAVGDGLFLPFTLPARVGSTAALVAAMGGYDSARSRPIAGTTAEVRLWGPLALRAGGEYTGNDNRARPTAGLRVQVLSQDAHGLDGAVSVFYRPEGFTEPEGEIETFLSVARRGELLSVGANLVYGQDPEGNERDGEVRLAVHHQGTRFVLGLDSRFRFAIGTQRGLAATAEPRFDLTGGPVVAVTAGPVALFTEVGPSIVHLSTRTFVGVAAMGGLGTVF